MKNVRSVVRATKKGRTPLYYSPKENAVYTEAGRDRFYLTDLLKPHTAEQIKKTVDYFLCL